MEVYDFPDSSDSFDSDDGSVFDGFNSEDVTAAKQAQTLMDANGSSDVSSVSTITDTDSDSSDSDISLVNTNDLHENPPDWTTDFVPIQVPHFN